uniref:RRM domain-containing protein n=1 Tax=Hanusia phi TaxID=3032 RepID=A0A7S0EJ91_9CRYP|mmetsp:Transcript_2464/g.5883  ORF Transcript_2464/g.5883 Transcript_2464/m.5883 type:complete len:158 (+) Transcript_2464:72-545(+)
MERRSRSRSKSPPRRRDERDSYKSGDRPSGGDGGTKLYVGNLSFDTKGEDLMHYFSKFGKVDDTTVIMDRDDPGRSRGFGFVTYSTVADAEYAITQTDNVEWMGRNIRVNMSRPRADGPRGGGRGGGGGMRFRSDDRRGDRYGDGGRRYGHDDRDRY